MSSNTVLLNVVFSYKPLLVHKIAECIQKSLTSNIWHTKAITIHFAHCLSFMCCDWFVCLCSLCCIHCCLCLWIDLPVCFVCLCSLCCIHCCLCLWIDLFVCFVCLCSVCCIQCCLCLWIGHSCIPLRFYLTFMNKTGKIN
jgi:hypothetical protein